MIKKLGLILCLIYCFNSYGEENQMMTLQSLKLPEELTSSNYEQELKVSLEAAFSAGSEIMRIRDKQYSGPGEGRRHFSDPRRQNGQ